MKIVSKIFATLFNCGCNTAHVWGQRRSRDSLQKLVLSFCHAGHKDSTTRVVYLGSKLPEPFLWSLNVLSIVVKVFIFLTK